MAKKSARPNLAGHDEGSRDVEGKDTTGAGGPGAARSGIKKVDAVRKALAAGKNSPDEGTDYIREQYGIEMANTQFSTVKSQLKKKGEEDQSADRFATPKKRKPLVEGYVAPPPRPQGEPDVLLALESVKELVETYGADKVRRIIDLLS